MTNLQNLKSSEPLTKDIFVTQDFKTCPKCGSYFISSYCESCYYQIEPREVDNLNKTPDFYALLREAKEGEKALKLKLERRFKNLVKCLAGPMEGKSQSLSKSWLELRLLSIYFIQAGYPYQDLIYCLFRLQSYQSLDALSCQKISKLLKYEGDAFVKSNHIYQFSGLSNRLLLRLLFISGGLLFISFLSSYFYLLTSNS